MKNGNNRLLFPVYSTEYDKIWLLNSLSVEYLHEYQTSLPDLRLEG